MMGAIMWWWTRARDVFGIIKKIFIEAFVILLLVSQIQIG